MRDLIDRSDLSRYAGQFVWLEMNFDTPRNRAFLTKFGATSTPTFFVVDPRNLSVTAMQPGAMSLEELRSFLDRGADGFNEHGQSSAARALQRGDSLRASHPGDAAKIYQEALRLAPSTWPDIDLARASLVGALGDAKQYEQCAETAVSLAPLMRRNTAFARAVVSAMWCLASQSSARWAQVITPKLQSLAQEALSLSTTVRDQRDGLYRTLMLIAVAHHDNVAAAKWGDLWLQELDAIRPASDEQRAALDIARVENIQTYGDPKRILPALARSEHEMPNSYFASLRLAEAQLLAAQYDDAIATCDRGLARSPGAVGQSWLLQIMAEALVHLGKKTAARRALQQALIAAQTIPSPNSRKNNIQAIDRMLRQLPHS